MTGEKKFIQYFYNWITYVGVFLSLTVFFIECFLFCLDFFSHHGDMYMGILTYVLLPPFLILGLVLIPVGALRKRSRVHAGKATLIPKVLKIDPSIPAHRNTILIFGIGTFILILMSSVGAYKAFVYTESVQFCGTMCHTVMNPEYTAYLHSPHAKVKCVSCHIGEGATWYVRSKLSGARQVLKTVTGTYENPIETPVKNLRPAEETCMECHWPGRFFSAIEYRRSYFLSGEDNPRWDLRMLMKVGGEGQSAGVHAHMNLDHDIYYAAEDEKREKITWVKSVDKEGKEQVFRSPDSKWKESDPPAEVIRQMDCIDCHNRPTHQFLPPYRLLNEAMSAGRIDPSVPGIKEKGLEVMSADYASDKEAFRKIPEEITRYYKTKHAEYYAQNPDKIEKASAEITNLFKQNVFPDMKTRWDIHPDNIGHLTTPGCFRCHDSEHKSVEGKVITRDCRACHTIVSQGPMGQPENDADGLEFRHPDGGDEWKEMMCSDCHTGGA